MRIITHRHHNKSDKCTQSPLLKIFKDMIQRENTDPEKINLLKDKTQDKNRKYCDSKSKSDKTNKTGTSFSEKHRHGSDKQVYNEKLSRSRTHSFPYQNDKKDSWWLWTDPDNREDTCSCVSCALKKIVNSEKMGYFILVLLFGLSMVAIVFYILPLLGCDGMKRNFVPNFKEFDSHILSNKIDMINKNKENKNKDKNWDMMYLRGDDSNAFSGQELSDRNLQELNDHPVEEGTLSPELASVLDVKKINEGSSDKVKSFFKNLLRMDTKIKKMKNTLSDLPVQDASQEQIRVSNRVRRSLQSVKRQNTYDLKSDLSSTTRDLSKFNLFYPPYLALDRKRRRSKRDNQTEPTGFIFEKKKYVIEYRPGKKIAKCSHMPKESKSHEHKLKHPFYKNSQRLDELLDGFFNKNFKDIVSNPIMDNIFNNDDKEKCQHNKYDKTYLKHDEIEDNVENKFGTTNSETETPFDVNPYIIHSMSTALFNNINESKISPFELEKSPGSRKLLQIGTKDANENSNDVDQESGFQENDETADPYPLEKKYSAPDSANPSWKGPMPLYPEEINFMIKQAAIRTVNKLSVPLNKDAPSELDETEEDLSNLNYIEDYVNNKHEKTVQVAQAYSDYGVLEGKKNFEDKSKLDNNKEKLSVDKQKFESPYTLRDPEVFSDLISKSTVKVKSDDFGTNLFNQIFHKHAKLKPDNSPNWNTAEYRDQAQFSQKLELVEPKSLKDDKNHESIIAKDRRNIFAIGRSRRSLKSIDFDETKPENEDMQRNVNVTQEKDSIDDILKFEDVVTDVGKDVKKQLKNTTTDTRINDSIKNGSDEKISIVKNELGPSDFLSMLSNFFRGLAGFGPLDNSSVPDPISLITSFTIPNVTKESSNMSVMFPMYDADMIDNIGHRSRVILSVDSTDDLKSNDVDKVEANSVTDKIATSRWPIPNTTKKEKQSTLLQKKNSTKYKDKSKKNKEKSKKNKEKNKKTKYNKKVKNETKLVVKRNVPGESNLIFWNNFYDDEYGVKYDAPNHNSRDKHSVKSNEMFKKSGKWLQEKIKKWKWEKKNEDKKRRERDVVSFGNYESEPYEESKIYSGLQEDAVTDSEESNKNGFGYLNSKIDSVLKRAAAAVQETKNKSPDQNKEDEIATSVMQQLLMLLTNVIDFQVQQRSCLKLPPDLKSFLEWLTFTDDEQADSSKLRIHLQDKPAEGFNHYNDEKLSESRFVSPTEPALVNPRLQCQSIIRGIQNLLQNYQEMSKRDKEMMLGVKEYLENQLDFFQRQLLAIDEYNMIQMMSRTQPSYRFKRSRPHTNEKDRKKRKIGRYLKKFGKKHTKSTVSYTESMIESVALNIITKGIPTQNSCVTQDDAMVSQKSIRNLQDVYYKAVEEAKKLSTGKQD